MKLMETEKKRVHQDEKRRGCERDGCRAGRNMLVMQGWNKQTSMFTWDWTSTLHNLDSVCPSRAGYASPLAQAPTSHTSVCS